MNVVNQVAVPIQIVVKCLIGQAIGKPQVLQKQVPGEVFRLTVEAGGQRKVFLSRQLCRLRAEREWNHDVNVIGVFQRGIQNVAVRPREGHAVLGYVAVEGA